MHVAASYACASCEMAIKHYVVIFRVYVFCSVVSFATCAANTSALRSLVSVDVVKSRDSDGSDGRRENEGVEVSGGFIYDELDEVSKGARSSKHDMRME